jgi:Na+/melibiose symporter-like transporter
VIFLLDISTPESFLEFFSTIAVILVIGVLAILYIAYYLQTNHVKRIRAEMLEKQQGSMKSDTIDVPSVYTVSSSTEST